MLQERVASSRKSCGMSVMTKSSVREELTQAECADQGMRANPGEKETDTLQLNLCPGREKSFYWGILGSMSPISS